MTVGDEFYKISLPDLGIEYIPTCFCVGFISDIILAKFYQFFGCAFRRINAKFFFNKTPNIIDICFCTFRKTKVIFLK